MIQKKATIDVAVALPVYRTFSYAVSGQFKHLAHVGKRVLVPFGNRRVTGYILHTDHVAALDDIKSILDILDDTPLFPESMVRFFQWVADYYMYPVGLVIKSALPGGLFYTEKNILTVNHEKKGNFSRTFLTPLEKNILKQLEKEGTSLKSLEKKLATQIPKALIINMLNKEWLSEQQQLKKDRIQSKMVRFLSLVESKIPQKSISEPRKKIIELLRNEGELSIQQIRKTVPHATRFVKAMAEDGYILIHHRQVFRDPFGEPVPLKKQPTLTPEQSKIVSSIKPKLGKKYTTFLLSGVTGSGKTEVYLQLAMQAVQSDLSVLVLVPEIALISQMERRFRARFGEQIAVLHSGLSPGERYDQWQKIARGKVKIAIGARSAIFSPFSDLGLIIVDEEHDTSYKQESSLRYNARDLAIVRAKQLDATALLGSATPSIQSYYNAATHKFKKVRLTKRVHQRPLPDIEIVDLCSLRDQRGHRRFISDPLLKALSDTLDRGEQAIIFLNRRGFANLPLCDSCGDPIHCKYCDISMTYHKKRNAYQCHYCGYSMAATTACPSCGSADILHLGFGTEKVEAMLASLFPGRRIQRMDRDTVRHKGSIVKILKGLKNQTIDILIGTQMVAKGHDFPNITLVGIICADLSLNFPDFRAAEQTFQMLAQVAGRAGRGDHPGKVILQTYNPDHFSIVCAKNQDIRSFYEQELGFRKELAYPPFSRMIQIVISSKDKDSGIKQANTVDKLCHATLKSNRAFKRNVAILGPVEAPFSKIASHYRWHMLFKSSNATLLHTFAHKVFFNNVSMLNRHNSKITIDVDPIFMM
jgi:primosomal protein N' (replication factor Y)